MNIQTVWTSKY